MKLLKAMMRIRTIIFGLILMIIAIAVAAITQVVVQLAGSMVNSEVIVVAIGLLYFLISWMGGNGKEFRYRKDKKEYKGSLPSNLVDEIRDHRSKFLDAALLTLIASIPYEIILAKIVSSMA